jgi:hypothetical protein
MLQTGGIDEGLIGQNLKSLEESGGNARRDISAQVSNTMPLGSSAAVSALTRGLGDQRTSQTEAMLRFLLDKATAKTGNQFGAVQGMEGLPSYISQPSSIELAMLGAKAPYETANLSSQNDWLSTLLAGMQGSRYFDELAIGKSPWEQTIGPLISAILMGLGKGPAQATG